MLWPWYLSNFIEAHPIYIVPVASTFRALAAVNRRGTEAARLLADRLASVTITPQDGFELENK
jgi:hypothetical protein